ARERVMPKSLALLKWELLRCMENYRKQRVTTRPSLLELDRCCDKEPTKDRGGSANVEIIYIPQETSPQRKQEEVQREVQWVEEDVVEYSQDMIQSGLDVEKTKEPRGALKQSNQSLRSLLMMMIPPTMSKPELTRFESRCYDGED
ncbi:hypothetical protein HAX54_036330, partial [Datura stramonium]|nr:hypothetical protein [Datura stramonium]